MSQQTRVHLISLGCSRNDVDSEELAGRLAAGGYQLVAEPEEADAVMVNTCGFVESAKQDSVDTLLAAADLKQSGKAQAVVAVGCMAERYGSELAGALPEADAVLGFDRYATIAEDLQRILSGESLPSHQPQDRRKLLPIAPKARPAAAGAVTIPGHAHHADAGPDLPNGLAPASGPRPVRQRLGTGPMAPLKMASGCDRRCTFCAIPAFRGAYLSRPPAEIVSEAQWLVSQGVREVFLVSENSTSYGKDLGDLRLMEQVLEDLSEVEGLEWIRVSYLQPAEMRPSLINAMTSVPKVVPYFDLSFQHAAPGVLKRMRRYGDPASFAELVGAVRAHAPQAGIRSNVIVGFPGETEDDVDVLADFLADVSLDVVGVFGYSDEDGTEAATMTDKVSADVIAERVDRITQLVSELTDQRAEERVGERWPVLVEEIDLDTGEVWGRAPHQGPEVDGQVRLVDSEGEPLTAVAVGDLVQVECIDSEGVDLVGTRPPA